jgi:hypothetical protein
MILNFFSFNNLYTNTLLFSFPVFLGNIALFRVFRRRFPDDPLTGFSVFLLPSVLYWTSCIHREGLLYMVLGFFLFYTDRLLTRPFSWRPAAYALLCLLLIAWFRLAFALTLLPAGLCWLAARKPRTRGPLIASAILLIGLALLAADWPGIIARHQHEFLILSGHSRLPLPPLDGSWGSLIRIIPSAVRNGCFEPLPGSGGQRVYWAFSIELLILWGIVGLALILNIRNRRNPYFLSRDPLLSSFGLFCLTFALAGMLVIGALIPFAGAIVRYRSIYLLFLLAPFLHHLRSLPLLQRLNHRLSSHLVNKL